MHSPSNIIELSIEDLETVAGGIGVDNNGDKVWPFSQPPKPVPYKPNFSDFKIDLWKLIAHR